LSVDIPSITTPGVAIHFDLYTFLVWIFVGLIAGALASRLMLGHGLGFATDIVVGIVGALIGGFLATYFGVQIVVPGHAIVTQILVALFGALILLLLLRLVGLGSRGRRTA
jgi:uncharacterized membrane protein YeaQ/YmgE (transglycosylase-associated protein family)